MREMSKKCTHFKSTTVNNHIQRKVVLSKSIPQGFLQSNLFLKKTVHFQSLILGAIIDTGQNNLILYAWNFTNYERRWGKGLILCLFYLLTGELVIFKNWKYVIIIEKQKTKIKCKCFVTNTMNVKDVFLCLLVVLPFFVVLGIKTKISILSYISIPLSL